MKPPSPPMTKHAEIRCQQRGLPVQILTWLDDYGSRAPAAGDAEIVYFNKPARRRLQRVVGVALVDRLAPLLDSYMIQLANGDITTAGWRSTRIRRERSRKQRRGQ